MSKRSQIEVIVEDKLASLKVGEASVFVVKTGNAGRSDLFIVKRGTSSDLEKYRLGGVYQSSELVINDDVPKMNLSVNSSLEVHLFNIDLDITDEVGQILNDVSVGLSKIYFVMSNQELSDLCTKPMFDSDMSKMLMKSQMEKFKNLSQ